MCRSLMGARTCCTATVIRFMYFTRCPRNEGARSWVGNGIWIHVILIGTWWGEKTKWNREQPHLAAELSCFAMAQLYVAEKYIWLRRIHGGGTASNRSCRSISRTGMRSHGPFCEHDHASYNERKGRWQESPHHKWVVHFPMPTILVLSEPDFLQSPKDRILVHQI